MRRALLMVLLLPLALGAELDDFLAANPAVPVTVSCGAEYHLYPYTRNGALDYVLVVRGDEPVFDYETYRRVVSAYLYKEHLRSVADSIRLLTPSAVPTFSALLSKMKDEEYDISVARSVVNQCFPGFAPQLDTLDSLRGQIVASLERFVQRLGKEAQDLVTYLRTPEVWCDYKVDVSVYDDFGDIVEALQTYESYSKQLRANMATAETNCNPDVVQSAIDALKPPYSSDQLQYFTTAAATEKELLAYQPTDDEIRALLQRTIKEYWKTLYEAQMNDRIHTDFGVFTLSDAVQFILSSPVSWRRADLVDRLEQAYNETISLAADGKYEEAYKRAKELRKTVEAIFRAGVAPREKGGIPPWVYAAVIIAVGIILWKMFGGRGGDEVEDDTYTYDYA